ncbi:MAG: 2-amino-4-hydroxy-6-hydroxymethyldihydropteridine diphosphokinase [Candidatus Eisenbacteria bacterium]|uniref:2-amino-4-hydroxy-6-hydroxymethyldihydropteridine diphosphokinase n=1 Tax=Eiseniibacteriota bacterium TaxID=2212470 RepID=A0A9D6L9W9_UNCEI|nr:2-amino-4-hydroxy-6-hydroxymethyldihydropteridine diphosphokinase [Candidatus Eisenbacteria bacterium]MBI3540484.1 2-amino-4-hydroxy-6-hydroxymethyldihydropteridine diphosphokinase [Candidatus Eisenbacteria bacterium]
MKAFIGLGSNLGEREVQIRLALDDLARLPATHLLRASSLYDSEPVGEVDQPNFLNAVAEIDTELTARQLLWNLLLIERRLGRVRHQKWGPRTIDLDLLLYGSMVVDEPDLQVPHPELVRRSFVLVPLVELDPLLVHPVTGETLLNHLSRLKARPPVKRGTRLWN